MQNAIDRVLITYDSPLGSTAEVAGFMGQTLRNDGHRVEVKPVLQVDDLAPYSRVLIGGAIRYDRWSPSAVAFIRAHRKRLQDMPVSSFFTCLTLARPTSAARRKAGAYADQIRAVVPDVQLLSVGQFAGVLKPSGMPWPQRLALRVLSLTTGVKEGDYRDWDAIRDWARAQLDPNFRGTSV